MCGIVGIYKFDDISISESELKIFANSLKHRGPDAEGTYICNNKNLGLGHKRLSILDTTSRANQPMLYAHDRYVIVFNGEIYNFLELKSELQDLGYKFNTTGDTEVILASFMEWGETCQFKFNGMWAFAIWDNKNKSLFLSRDRFGVKPLYYLFHNNKFFFASELKAFMSLNRENIPEFNYYNFLHLSRDYSNSAYTVIEDTFLENVKELNPGYQLEVKANKNLETKKWWSTLKNLIEVPKNYNDQVEKFKYLFFDACKLRMRSDVNIATSLSGGLDSSAIVGSINHFKNINEDLRNTQFPHNAFILNYKNEIDNEMDYAKSVIENTNIKANFVDLEMDKVEPEEIIKVIYHQEEVTGDEGLGPWFIYKSIKENNIKVDIAGEGGDELLAGYTGYPRIAMTECNFPIEFNRWLDLLLIHIKMNDKSPKIKNNLVLVIKKFLQSINSRINRFKKLQDINYNFFLIEPKKPSSLPQDDISMLSNLNKSLYIDYHYRSLSKNLKKYDKFSMAHGVESRYPFLDWRLATYLFSLPSKSKIGNGFTKKILRDSMKNILPNKILNRVKKRGFVSSNQLFNKSIVKFIHDTVSSRDFYQSNIWDGKKIKHLIENNKQINYRKIFRYLQIYFLIKTFKMNVN